MQCDARYIDCIHVFFDGLKWSYMKMFRFMTDVYLTQSILQIGKVMCNLIDSFFSNGMGSLYRAWDHCTGPDLCYHHILVGWERVETCNVRSISSCANMCWWNLQHWLWPVRTPVDGNKKGYNKVVGEAAGKLVQTFMSNEFEITMVLMM